MKLDEIKKEFIELFTEDGSYKVQADYNTVWEWIEKTITQREREAVEGFAKWLEVEERDALKGTKLGGGVILGRAINYTRFTNKAKTYLFSQLTKARKEVFKKYGIDTKAMIKLDDVVSHLKEVGVSITRMTLIRYIHEGKLTADKIANKWYIDGDSLLQFLANRRKVAREKYELGTFLYNITQTAKKLNVHRSTIHRWINEGKIKANYISNTPYITEEEIRSQTKGEQ